MCIVRQRGLKIVGDSAAREGWEEELYHKTRVDGFGGRVDEVHARLRRLWKAAQPMTESQGASARRQITLPNNGLDRHRLRRSGHPEALCPEYGGMT